jgi:uncharacterized protein YlxP (DUF503 family)
MYKLINGFQNSVALLKTNDAGNFMAIPFDTANSDYTQFKKAINEGAQLLDADGNIMTPEQAKDYVKELP